MIALSLGLAIVMVTKPAQGGVFMLNQDTLEMGKQCKELIVQHVLTSGRSQFDPEVVANCITFLRSENLEHQETNPTGAITNVSTNKHTEDITTRPVPERESVTSHEKWEDSEVTSNQIKDDLVRAGSKESQEILKDPLLSEDSKPGHPKEDDLIDIYPENIVQEWPAVEMVRKKRDVQKATKVKANTKKDTAVVSTGKQPWEQYSLKDALMLDERSRNRPKTRFQGVKLCIKRFINWLKTVFGIGPRVN